MNANGTAGVVVGQGITIIRDRAMTCDKRDNRLTHISYWRALILSLPSNIYNLQPTTDKELFLDQNLINFMSVD